MLDLAILGGTVIDGTGGPGYLADVGVQGDQIVRLGRIAEGESGQAISAVGNIVCPGFIDTHSHSDIMALAEPANLPKLMQGITTEVVGQDGIAAAPMKPEMSGQWRQYLTGLSGNPPIVWDWNSIGQYAARLASAHPSTNMAILVPQGNVRMMGIGMENVMADEKQMHAMEAEVCRGMEEGAWGISLGLIYAPCSFSRRDELVRLFQRCGKKGGFLAVHLRSQSDLLLESMEEVMAIAQEAEIPLHVSHLKAMGRRNWHKMQMAIEIVDRAYQRGLDITFDIYPYAAGSTIFLAVLPPWVLEGGIQPGLERLRDRALRSRIRNEILHPTLEEAEQLRWDNHANLVGWENIVISSVGTPKNQAWVGRSVQNIAKDLGKDPSETAFDILLEEEGRVGMIMFNMEEGNVLMGLRHPLAMVGTDGILGGKPHPRVYGTFPRILGRCVRQTKGLTLVEAVRKMTSLAAGRLGLKDRGVLKEGKAADLVVFDPETILDLATYENPRQHPVGIRHVIVNGVQSVADGKFTGQCAGRVLRRE